MSETDSLHTIESQCWTLLEQAVADRECGWRLPVMATSADGIIRQRTLVLRAVDHEHRHLLFHTDRRSPKVRHILADPRISLLFYDHARAVQLQVRGTAAIHADDDLADAMWRSSPPEALRGYLAPLAPGTIVGRPNVNLPEHLRDRIPGRSEVESGRDNFAVICVKVLRLDYLLLARTGNLRAGFDYNENQAPDARWIAP